MSKLPSSPLVALVVEPDAAQRHQIVSYLGGQYHVLMAERLAEAVDLIARARPAVLVLEPNLPDGDGIHLIRRVRSDPVTREMIVACVTTRNGIRDKVAGFQAGADDYTIKPIDPETFRTRMALLVRLRRLSS